MILPDSASSPLSTNSPKKSAFRIPSVADRLLAFVFDVAFFTPIVALMLSGVSQRLEHSYFMDGNSNEFLIYLFVYVAFAFVQVMLLQSLFLVLFSSTPGKMIFKMKLQIRDADSAARIRLPQALLRSFLWTLSLGMFFLPMIEILSHRRRQTLYDRASDLEVVSLKKDFLDHTPHWLEAQFVRQFLFAGTLLLSLFVVSQLGKIYQKVAAGEFRSAPKIESELLCEMVSQMAEDKKSRAEMASMLFLVGEADQECLFLESEYALGHSQPQTVAQGYLGKFLLSLSKQGGDASFELEDLVQMKPIGETVSYAKKICEVSADSPECGLVLSWPMGKSIYELSGPVPQLIQLQMSFTEGNWAQFEQLVLGLREQQGVYQFVSYLNMQSLWSRERYERARGAFEALQIISTENIKQRASRFLCLAERSESCQNQLIPSCQILNLAFNQRSEAWTDPRALWALVQDEKCKGTQDYSRFSQDLRTQDTLKNFVRNFASNEKSLDTRRKYFQSFFQDETKNIFLREVAFQEWVPMTQSWDDFKLAHEHLKMRPSQSTQTVRLQSLLAEQLKRSGYSFADLDQSLPSEGARMPASAEPANETGYSR